MQADFGPTADDYARHRAGFPDSLFHRLSARGIGLRQQSVVDLGTGLGSLARGFARRGCRVTGVDHSAPMMARAAELDAEEGIRVQYRLARAEETGLPAGAAHVASAGQCWHWFDRPRAAAESARILCPDGWLVIAHFDWLPIPGGAVAATEELIARHNPAWDLGGGSGLHPAWLIDLDAGAWREIESFSYDVTVPYTHAGWRGRLRASAGVGASLSPPGVAAFDDELARLLAARFPNEPLQLPHRVFAVCARRPAP